MCRSKYFQAKNILVEQDLEKNQPKNDQQEEMEANYPKEIS